MTTELVICNHVEECGRNTIEECEHSVPHKEYKYCYLFNGCRGWKDVICVPIWGEPDWEI